MVINSKKIVIGHNLTKWLSKCEGSLLERKRDRHNYRVMMMMMLRNGIKHKGNNGYVLWLNSKGRKQ